MSTAAHISYNSLRQHLKQLEFTIDLQKRFQKNKHLDVSCWSAEGIPGQKVMLSVRESVAWESLGAPAITYPGFSKSINLSTD